MPASTTTLVLCVLPGLCVCRVSPAQLLLEVRHVLVTLCVVRRLGLHKVVQTAQVVGLQCEQDRQSLNSGHQRVQCTGGFSQSTHPLMGMFCNGNPMQKCRSEYYSSDNLQYHQARVIRPSFEPALWNFSTADVYSMNKYLN